MKEFLIIVGLIFLLIGVIAIYDARPLTKKMFGFGDQNDATLGLKIFGFLFSIIGMILVYCNM